MTSASTVQQIVSLKEAPGGRSLARDAVRRLMRNPLALLAGYYGGLIDTLIMRITDVFLAFPLLLLAIALVAALGPSENSAFLALGIVTWPYVARLARGQALSLRAHEFVTAARSVGAS